jgi:hypothetical protein
MLKDEVADAVREGSFRIFEIDRVEEGVEVLMGIPAGEMAPDGQYPEGTLYRKAADRLQELREAVREKNDDGKKG